MSHFRKKATSPLITMSFAYGYVTVVIAIVYATGFYRDNPFFTWGPPVQFFGKAITSSNSFYLLHLLIFCHQLVNNWVNSVVYAWIINNIQDPKNKRLEYSPWLCLFIINIFSIYSELDVIFIVMGFTSQISFVVTIISANIITSTYINRQYILAKEDNTEERPILIEQV